MSLCHQAPGMARSPLLQQPRRQPAPNALSTSCRRLPRTGASGSEPSYSSRRVPDAEAAAWEAANPDLDEIELNDAYYEEIGMSREAAMRQQRELLYSVDPDARPLDDLGSVSDALPEEWRAAIESLEVFGPQALLMAGFRAEEYAMVRATLDSLGAHEIKVLPVSAEMLQSPLELVLAEPEVDWSAPRPPEWILGGAWGSQRTVMFSGLSVKSQATLVELLEAQGLPPVCVTMALQQDAGKRLGDLMAAAVKAQRSMKAGPPVAPWEVSRQSAAPPRPPPASSSSNRQPPAAAPSPADVRKALAASLPGKRGPLFSRQPGSSSAGAGRLPAPGLEPLELLISPEMARARLQAEPVDSAGIADLLDLDIPDSSDEGSPGLADYLSRLQNTTNTDSSDTWQQQEGDGGAGTVGGSADAAGPLDDQTQQLLDWFAEGDGEGGPGALELPWSDSEQQQQQQQPGGVGAAAAAAGAGFRDVERHSPRQQQQQQNRPETAAGGQQASEQAEEQEEEQEGEEDDGGISLADMSLLDDLLPPLSSSNSGLMDQQQQQQQPTPRAAPAPPAQAAAAAGDAGEQGESSVLSAIQAALQSGIDPEQLKQLIDAAAARGAVASDPIDLMMREDEAQEDKPARQAPAPAAAAGGPAASSSSGSSSGGSRQPAAAAAGPARQQQQQPRQPQRAFGPQPPPASPAGPGGEPLLKLRPEIEAAFANNQVKFVDMNKLPAKYKRQYTLAGRQQQQQRQQQEAALRAQLQQQAAKSPQQGRLEQLLDGQEPAEAAAPAAVEQPAAEASGPSEQQQQQQQGKGRQQQRWWQQRQPLSQGLAGKALSQLPTGGKLVEVDVNDASVTGLSGEAGTAPGSSSSSLQQLVDAEAYQQQQQLGVAGSGSDSGVYGDSYDAAAAAAGFGSYDGGYDDEYDGEFDGESDDDGEDGEQQQQQLELDEGKLTQLVDEARQQGLQVDRAIAEAMAFGIRVDPAAAAAVGVEMPSPELVAEAQQRIVDSIRQMQEGGEGGEQQQQQEEEEVAAAVPGSGGRPQRVWGSGLSSAVARAKARVAQKKSQAS